MLSMGSKFTFSSVIISKELVVGQTVSDPQQLHTLVQSCHKVSANGLAMSTTSNTGIPLKQGFWKLGDMRAWILKTTGTTTMIMKNLITTDFPNIDSGGLPFEFGFGNFGEAREEIKEATGEKGYNIKVNSAFYNYKGILHRDGAKITTWGMSNQLEEWLWIDDQMLQNLKDERDPYIAPR